jgi:hypothetical protein
MEFEARHHAFLCMSDNLPICVKSWAPMIDALHQSGVKLWNWRLSSQFDFVCWEDVVMQCHLFNMV